MQEALLREVQLQLDNENQTMINLLVQTVVIDTNAYGQEDGAWVGINKETGLKERYFRSDILIWKFTDNPEDSYGRVRQILEKIAKEQGFEDKEELKKGFKIAAEKLRANR